MGSGNWIVDNLNSALGTWNGKLAEIWQLLSTTNWTLDEHLLFQRRLCRDGVALMSKRTAEVKV